MLGRQAAVVSLHVLQGYIVKVVLIHHIGDGTILPGGEGKAEFNSKYSAIVMKPVSGLSYNFATPLFSSDFLAQFKGEVVDAEVTNVNKVSGQQILSQVVIDLLTGLILYFADGLFCVGRTSQHLYLDTPSSTRVPLPA